MLAHHGAGDVSGDGPLRDCCFHKLMDVKTLSNDVSDDYWLLSDYLHPRLVEVDGVENFLAWDDGRLLDGEADGVLGHVGMDGELRAVGLSGNSPNGYGSDDFSRAISLSLGLFSIACCCCLG